MSFLNGTGSMHIQGWEKLLMAVFTGNIHQHAQIFINIFFSVGSSMMLVNSQASEFDMNCSVLSCELFIERSAVSILDIIEQLLKMITVCVDLVFCSLAFILCCTCSLGLSRGWNQKPKDLKSVPELFSGSQCNLEQVTVAAGQVSTDHEAEADI